MCEENICMIVLVQSGGRVERESKKEAFSFLPGVTWKKGCQVFVTEKYKTLF